MFQDHIVEQVREIRLKIEADCDNDSQKYFEHIQRVQKEHLKRLVRFAPKPALEKNLLIAVVGKGYKGPRGRQGNGE